MLIKLIGGGCVILAGALLGDTFYKTAKKRTETLRLLECYAAYAEKQIASVRMSPRELLHTFPQRAALLPLTENGGNDGGLKQEEADAFRAFFTALGSGGWEEEQHRCDAYLDTVRVALQQAQTDLGQQKNRCLLLGAAAGAGISLLLW